MMLNGAASDNAFPSEQTYYSFTVICGIWQMWFYLRWTRGLVISYKSR